MTLHLAVLAAGFGLARGARAADATNTPGLSHDGESIHQEIHFDATRHRVYAALTNADQFDAVSKLGVAAKSMKWSEVRTAPSRVFALRSSTASA